ncbi:UPF0147 family protein [Candidatus Woesearchaeota archaeon]|nr:UPF0147 family protein [Candidatus Woesearchaeota archaeon]
MGQEAIESIESALKELKEDAAAPKNVKMKIEKAIGILRKNSEITIKVSKALNELEEVADDVNLQSYTRMQVLNVISALEKIK